MSGEALMAAAYAAFLIAAAGLLEWLSAHTHRRSLRYRTAGFEYDRDGDHWRCPEGEHLYPHEFDEARRLMRYRARAHVCNACASKGACTDSSDGREVVRPVDPWPHSEAGRFHRGLSLVLLALALLVLVVAGVRNHAPAELAALAALALVALAAARFMLRDFRRHPAGPAAQGLGVATTGADGIRPRSRWASQNRS